MADNEDRKVIDLVGAHDKEAADLIDRLQQSAGSIKFPVGDVKELVNAMGGANTKVTLGGKDVTVGHLAAKVPGYYFPIADEHELIAKLADLALQQGGPAAGSAAAGKLIEAKGAKPDHDPPKISDDEFKKAKAANPGLHVGGFKKQP